jgi:hypothetical protein
LRKSISVYQIGIYSLLLVVLSAFPPNAYPQAAPPARIMGEVTAINAGNNQVTIKTDKGDISVALGERTRYLRIKPGETDASKAVKIALSDLGNGDRVLALGKLSEDGKGLTATSLYVMTKSDISQKQQHDQAEWQTRGITGTVTAIAPDTRQITVNVHTMQGAKSIVIESDDTTDYRRYSPDSVRFSDAKPSSFKELKTGDSVRALGEKSADGSHMKAEAMVSGTFRSISATIVSVDPAANEIKVTDLASKKPLTVKVNSDTTMRKLPQPMAMALARRYNPQFFASAGGRRGGGGAGGPGGGGAGGPGGGGPGGRGPGGGAGGEGGMRFSGSGGADLSQALEKVPALPISELNKGDAILISSTAGTDPSRVTAISLVAGVEPLLTKASGERINLDWSLDMSGPQQ